MTQISYQSCTSATSFTSSYTAIVTSANPEEKKNLHSHCYTGVRAPKLLHRSSCIKEPFGKGLDGLPRGLRGASEGLEGGLRGLETASRGLEKGFKGLEKGFTGLEGGFKEA